MSVWTLSSTLKYLKRLPQASLERNLPSLIVHERRPRSFERATTHGNVQGS